MLVLSRKINERIRIGPNIVITVVQIAAGKVRIGIDAPRDVAILRDELDADGADTPAGPVPRGEVR